MSNWRHPDRDHPATDYSNMDGGLMAALTAGDRRTLEMLAEQGFDFDKPHGHGKTALHWAAETNNISAMKLLMEFGASLDVVDDFRRTPLMLAARSLNEDCAITLVQGGADPSISDQAGETPLHRAAWSGMEELTSALLATKRAPLDVYNTANILPIHRAADKDNLKILKALLDAGANPNLKDHANRTSLHLAAGGGRGEAVVLMLKYGGKLDAMDTLGQTPLKLAAKYGKTREMGPVYSYLHSARLKRTYRKMHPSP